MPMEVMFLSAKMPLTKKYERLADGTIKKEAYPKAFKFTSHHETISTLPEFERCLRTHSDQQHCLIKGILDRPLFDESRANHTSNLDPTHWVCLDVDGLPNDHSIDSLLSLLGIGDVSYVLQWSASYKIPATEKSLRCHIFMLLAEPAMPGELRQWLMGLNLNTPFLRAATHLAPAGNTLHWPVDITACQNDKLLYIADPVLIGIPNPLTKGKRIALVRKTKTHLTLPLIPTYEANHADQHTRVSELRKILGLEVRKPATFKTMGNDQVIQNPERATLTGPVQYGRGWVYLNINGGDSFAYFHHLTNADVIYNFKGEDPVLTSKFLPDYYPEAKARAKAAAREEEIGRNTGVQEAKERNDENEVVATSIQLLAFQDKGGSYWVGSYDAQTNVLDVYRKKSEKQVRDFCAENGMHIGDFVPQWKIDFDPQSDVRVDPVKRIVNRYHPSSYLLAPIKTKVKAPPPTIFKVIHHALGSDMDITERFMNWLAFIVQKRERTGTAWVLYGTEGTGKGVMYSHILRPLLGEAQTTMNQVEQMSKGFNAFIRNKLLIAFDEVHIGIMKDREEILGKLRGMISEPTVQIRDLYQSPEETPNHANYLIFSNKRDAVQLSETDRRYNVGKYQHDKLNFVYPEFDTDFDKVTAQIKSELQAFAFYMRDYKLKEQDAKKPMDSTDRDNLIATNSNTADDISKALGLRTANMQWLIDQLPSDERKKDRVNLEAMRDYKQVLVDNMLRTIERVNSPKRQRDEPNGVMTRDEAQTIFRYTGDLATKEAPARFIKIMRHHHLEPIKVWIDNRSINGLKMNWTDVDKFPEYLKLLGYKEKA